MKEFYIHMCQVTALQNIAKYYNLLIKVFNSFVFNTLSLPTENMGLEKGCVGNEWVNK